MILAAKHCCTVSALCAGALSWLMNHSGPPLLRTFSADLLSQMLQNLPAVVLVNRLAYMNTAKKITSMLLMIELT
jgi:hypothetical protein